jgi:hypothetical protein
MLKLKNILNEVLNTYQVNADILTNVDFNITDVLDQIRAIRKITIVRNITPEDYPQKNDIEYTLVTIKFITRSKPEEDLIKIKEDILTSDMSKKDLRVPGVRAFKFKEETLNRI